MKTRPLGNTGIDLPILSFGASSLGAEFRSITLDEAMLSTKTAIELGMNFIDTSPFYGRGMSEIMLGLGLKGVPRESYLLAASSGVTRTCISISPPSAWKNPSTFHSSASAPITSTFCYCTMWNSCRSNRFGKKRCPPF